LLLVIFPKCFKRIIRFGSEGLESLLSIDDKLFDFIGKLRLGVGLLGFRVDSFYPDEASCFARLDTFRGYDNKRVISQSIQRGVLRYVGGNVV
jgi:hypothetical protein